MTILTVVIIVVIVIVHVNRCCCVLYDLLVIVLSCSLRVAGLFIRRQDPAVSYGLGVQSPGKGWKL